MRSRIQTLRLLLPLLVFIVVQATQSQVQLRKFDVTSVEGGPMNPLSPFERKAMDVLTSKLVEKGALADYKEADWTFYILAKEFSGNNNIVLCISAFHRLPQNVIDLCKKQEVFYSSYSDEKQASLPPEGKPVREMLSEEMMREYMRMPEQTMLVTSVETLDEDLRRFVENFYREYHL